MHDAVQMLSVAAREAFRRGALADIAYADDTLLLSVSPSFLQEYLIAITKAGQLYGLELHNGKLQLLNVRCNTTLLTLEGELVNSSQQMTYLGGTLDDTGGMQNELTRRLGAAKGHFRTLAKVWKSSTTPGE